MTNEASRAGTGTVQGVDGRGEAPMVVARIPSPLRDLTAGADEVAVRGDSVGAALRGLLARYPGLRRHMRAEDGALREHVNVFLNADDIRHLDGEATPVREGDVLTVVPSIAGG
jgi:molybdopterin synthase sulfur carrier subunit